MKIILYCLLKKKISKEIERLGFGLNEIFIDIPLSVGICNSIELDTNDVVIHIFDEFEGEEWDIIYFLDDLYEEDCITIYKTLKQVE